jgi:hypothetical protein
MPANFRFSQQSDEGYLSSTDRGRRIFEVGDNGPECGRFALSIQSDISAISIRVLCCRMFTITQLLFIVRDISNVRRLSENRSEYWRRDVCNSITFTY